MVGVAGSNPVVSTKFTQHVSDIQIRDAEECRELAPALELILAEALAFLRRPIMDCVCFKKQLRLLFYFRRQKKS